MSASLFVVYHNVHISYCEPEPPYVVGVFGSRANAERYVTESKAYTEKNFPMLTKYYSYDISEEYLATDFV